MADRIREEEFEEKVLKSDLPALVEFYSDSCIACKKMAPVLGQTEKLLEDKVRFYKVNTTFEHELTKQYGILSSPTLIVFENGQEAGRKTGVMKPQELVDWLS